MVVSDEVPTRFYFLPFADGHYCRAFALILSYMQNGGRGWFVDVSAGLSHPRHVRHIPIGSRVIKEGT
jgi:hypothetical protein